MTDAMTGIKAGCLESTQTRTMQREKEDRLRLGQAERWGNCLERIPKVSYGE